MVSLAPLAATEGEEVPLGVVLREDVAAGALEDPPAPPPAGAVVGLRGGGRPVSNGAFRVGLEEGRTEPDEVVGRAGMETTPGVMATVGELELERPAAGLRVLEPPAAGDGFFCFGFSAVLEAKKKN